MTVNPSKQTLSESPWNKSFILNQHLLQPFSIEILPKQNFDCASLQRLLPANTKIFIPHLPRTTLKEIINTVQNLKLAGFEPIPHIAARRISDASELDALLMGLYDIKVQELLLIAGSRDEPLGEYQQCIDLLDSEIFNQFRFKRLLFAGHPDSHPDVNREKIEAALIKKIQLANKIGYESAIVTQFCFNIRATYLWLQRIRKAGIDKSVYIGVTGPTKFKTLLHYATICGVSTSVDQFIKQPLQMWKLFFKANPDYFINTLLKQSETENKIAGFHLFPFGGVHETIQWAEQFVKYKNKLLVSKSY